MKDELLYRELERGEAIKAGDESYNYISKKWQTVEQEHVGCGQKYDPEIFLKMRRKA